ncbi:DnaD domain protein [Solibacillus sp. FSL R7-0668]|uniref:DnaD domain protein n=1 Tax=Solibacillus sp. FSL R7-0668 TaxID=2921688 RepID=UPI0030FC9BBE
MAEQNNRAFKGVWISKEIWLAKDLGWSEKLLLVEIDSLDGEQGCFASNEYLANFFGLSKDRISKMVSSLKKKGYITVQVFYKEGTKQIDKRVIRLNRQPYPIGENADTLSVKTTRGIGENNDTPIGENAEDNNTVINNTTNNTKNKRKKEGDKPLPPSSLIDREFLKVKNHFETHVIYQQAAYVQTKAISDWMDDGYQSDLIIKAMDIAVERGKPALPYINGILKTWRADGIINIQQLLAKEAQANGIHTGHHAGHNGPSSSPVPSIITKRSSLE